MNIKNLKPLFAVILLFSTLIASAQIVRMETVLGNIDIELRPDVAPITVENFLKYVRAGDYKSSFFHRSVKDFIIQGGGYTYINGVVEPVTSKGTIQNEFDLLNTRGTIAMAKVDGNPNSATSQWFFNLVDNTSLDTDNGGFTVFGSVVEGMDVVDAIAALVKWNVGTPFTEIPLIDWSGSGSVGNDLVLITDIYVKEFKINSGLNGAWFNPDTAGQGILIETLPTLNKVFMGWYTYDLQAPADDVTSSIGSADQRWFTGLGDISEDKKSVIFPIRSTSDGIFDSSQTVTTTPSGDYGTLTINFEDCTKATATYTIISPALTGEFSLVRIAADNVELCESFSRESN